VRLQPPRPRHDPAAILCATGGALTYRGDILVRPGSSPGAMPGMPVRIHPGVGGINQRMMHATAVLRGGRAIGGGSNEWMRELHAPADLKQPSAHRRVGSSHVEADRLPRCLGAREQPALLIEGCPKLPARADVELGEHLA
jgi:hypothetical protein